MFATVCSTYHNTELQSFSATNKGSKEGALLSSTLISIPVPEQLAAGIVALRGGQLPMHMVLCHHIMVAINGAEDQGDRRQGLGAARLAVTERVQSGTRRRKVPYSAPKQRLSDTVVTLCLSCAADVHRQPWCTASLLLHMP